MRRQMLGVLGWLVASLWMAPGGGARAELLYEVRDLGLGRGVALNLSRQALIQDGGQVVLWVDGTRETLFDGLATGLNDQGDVTGRTGTGAQARGLVRRAGVNIDLGPGIANALNNLGVVVGRDGTGVYFWVDGQKTYFDELEERDVRALNDAGSVAGNTISDTPMPFVFDGVDTTIVPVEGFASDINNLGEYVYTQLFDDGAALFLVSQGSTLPLGLLGDDTEGIVNALNGSTQVVGRSGGRGFVWVENLMSDLNTLIVPAQAGLYQILSAIDINENGDILAIGARAGETSLRTFLLTPRANGAAVPEPSTAVLACTGAALLLLFARRRARGECKL